MSSNMDDNLPDTDVFYDSEDEDDVNPIAVSNKLLPNKLLSVIDEESKSGNDSIIMRGTSNQSLSMSFQAKDLDKNTLVSGSSFNSNQQQQHKSNVLLATVQETVHRFLI